MLIQVFVILCQGYVVLIVLQAYDNVGHFRTFFALKSLGPRINLFKIQRRIWRDLSEPVMMVWSNLILEQVTNFHFSHFSYFLYFLYFWVGG